MKVLIITMFLMGVTYSLPVLNESVGTNSVYTIFPDHKDDSLFYVSPNYMSVAEDFDGTPLISYVEYRARRRRVYSIVNVILKAKIFSTELEKAKKTIRKKRPDAVFAMIPFFRSEIKLGDRFAPLVFRHTCDHIAGEFNTEQSCTIHLTNLGTVIFKRSIHNPAALVMNFIYHVRGVALNANNEYVDATRVVQIAGRIGGEKVKSVVCGEGEC